MDHIVGDGNCLYRCFAQHRYGDQNLHLRVRAECNEYIRSHIQTFRNIFPHLDMDAEIEEQEHAGRWAGSPQLYALSHLYGIRVTIWDAHWSNNPRNRGLVPPEEHYCFNPDGAERLHLERANFHYHIMNIDIDQLWQSFTEDEQSIDIALGHLLEYFTEDEQSIDMAVDQLVNYFNKL